jgi:16S rRNA (adenine1518-N6/adenine1519-N6)-dimethyltransferase
VCTNSQFAVKLIYVLTKKDILGLLDNLDHKPTKKLGQNFVVEGGIIDYVVKESGVQAGDTVVEVGSGLGSLTLGLLKANAKVVAVEIEKSFADLLPKTVKKFLPDKAENLKVINKDALKLTKSELREVLSVPIAPATKLMASPPSTAPTACAATSTPTIHLVANLPYNVAFPILLYFIQTFDIASATVMVQKEVAERLTATRGSKIYGIPSLKLAFYGNAKMLSKTIGEKAFYPMPNVKSAIVKWNRDDKWAKDEVAGEASGDVSSEARRVFALIDMAFSMRRKTLRNALKPLGSIEASFEKADISPESRAEELGIEDFVKLAKALPIQEESGNSVRKTYEVSVKVPGKINLFLRCLGTEEKKHLLETLFHSVNIFDEISISVDFEKTKGRAESFVKPYAPKVLIDAYGLSADKIPLDESNLAHKAAALFLEHINLVEVGRANNVALREVNIKEIRIKIDKQIPISGGMAGGSADAAGTLLALNRALEDVFGDVFGRNARDKEGFGILGVDALYELAAELGADVPFMLYACLCCGIGQSSSALGTHFGDKLEPIELEHKFIFVLVTSNKELSTPKIYAKFDELAASNGAGGVCGDECRDGQVDACDSSESSADNNMRPNIQTLITALQAGNFQGIRDNIHNDLEIPAITALPELKEVISLAELKGATRSFITGSGPTVVALAKDYSAAQKIKHCLEKQGFNAFIARSS